MPNKSREKPPIMVIGTVKIDGRIIRAYPFDNESNPSGLRLEGVRDTPQVFEPR
jgi:hypothetical protein